MNISGSLGVWRQSLIRLLGVGMMGVVGVTEAAAEKVEGVEKGVPSV